MQGFRKLNFPPKSTGGAQGQGRGGEAGRAQAGQAGRAARRRARARSCARHACRRACTATARTAASAEEGRHQDVGDPVPAHRGVGRDAVA